MHAVFRLRPLGARNALFAAGLVAASMQAAGDAVHPPDQALVQLAATSAPAEPTSATRQTESGPGASAARSVYRKAPEAGARIRPRRGSLPASGARLGCRGVSPVDHGALADEAGAGTVASADLQGVADLDLFLRLRRHFRA